MVQSHEVDVSGRTLNAKKEHIWGFAQIAPSDKFRPIEGRELNDDALSAVQKATNLPHQSAYSMALVATLLTREEFAAQCLYLAMKGLGTDERAMIHILAHSTKEEVELIKVGKLLAIILFMSP
eukprot:1154357-Pelagomonas_calceolata.AAC.4